MLGWVKALYCWLFFCSAGSVLFRRVLGCWWRGGAAAAGGGAPAGGGGVCDERQHTPAERRGEAAHHHHWDQHSGTQEFRNTNLWDLVTDLYYLTEEFKLMLFSLFIWEITCITVSTKTTVFNTDNNQKCFKSVYYYDFWRSCDSEDCSNDAENTAAHHRNKL